jgi:hypothetical protein
MNILNKETFNHKVSRKKNMLCGVFPKNEKKESKTP